MIAFPGRTVVASTYIGVDDKRGVKSWVVGICVASIALIALIVLIATMPDNPDIENEKTGINDGTTPPNENNGTTQASTDELEEVRLDNLFYSEVSRNATLSELAGVTDQNVSVSSPGRTPR